MTASAIILSTNIVTILSAMSEEDFIWFFDRNNGTVKDACDLIDRIKNLWTTRFDCVLEQWLIRHPEDNDKEAFSEASTGRTYTWADILEELRLQTSVGKSFEQKLNEYYIYQLNRSNK